MGGGEVGYRGLGAETSPSCRLLFRGRGAFPWAGRVCQSVPDPAGETSGFLLDVRENSDVVPYHAANRSVLSSESRVSHVRVPSPPVLGQGVSVE